MRIIRIKRKTSVIKKAIIILEGRGAEWKSIRRSRLLEETKQV